MIKSWRAQWGQGDFPFLIQQLANFGGVAKDPNVPQNWAILREAQTQVASTVPHSGFSVAIDIGEAGDIHPKNKQYIGKRLALVALRNVYGKEVESSGPQYDSMKVEGPAIRLQFSHAKGLTSKDGPAKNFAIAGEDKKFVWR
jgi:sialate O-acetylesterase